MAEEPTQFGSPHSAAPPPAPPSKADPDHRNNEPLTVVELPLTVSLGPGAAAGDPDRTLDIATEASPAAPPVPARIGRYRVIRVLGRGGFGTVYLGHDDLGERPVAIKVPRADRLESAHAVEAFLSEARHVSRLKHAGIVTLYDIGREGDLVYLVYEFIEGVSLAERMRRGPLPHTEAALLVAEVADALHYAHGENI